MDSQQPQGTPIPEPFSVEGSFDQLWNVSASVEKILSELARLWVDLQALKLHRIAFSAMSDGNRAAELQKLDLDWANETGKFSFQLAQVEAELTRELALPQTPSPAARGEGLMLEEALILRRALTRLDLLRSRPEQGERESKPARLPVPDSLESGMVPGRSRVFIFFVPNDGTGLRIVAKFDDPKRAEKEWKAIDSLRHLNLPANTIMPHPMNRRTDGMILYPAAVHPGLRNYFQLRDYWRRNLRAAPDHCIRCLDLLLEPLRFLYAIRPGNFGDRGASERSLTWADVYPSEDFPDPTAITLPLGSDGKPIANPLLDIRKLLDEKTGLLRLSQIHGDLNLTNVLVFPLLDETPTSINVIDLANSKPFQPTATDLAYLEAEFWLHVFLGEAKGQEAECRYRDFVLIQDFLSGRRGVQPPSLESREWGEGALRLVVALRQRAFRLLEPPEQLNYVMGDFYHCLGFTFLSELRHADVSGNESKARLAIVGATGAFQATEDRASSRYAANARHRLVSPGRVLFLFEPND